MASTETSDGIEDEAGTHKVTRGLQAPEESIMGVATDPESSPIPSITHSPTPSPVNQQFSRAHNEQVAHRKFLLAIPAVTVLAVAAVVLFYAITWNDKSAANDEFGGQVYVGEEERAGPLMPKGKPRALPPRLDTRKMPRLHPKSKPNSNIAIGFVPKIIATTEEPPNETDQDDGIIPWPSYEETNLTDEYAEDTLFKMESLRLHKPIKKPLIIDLVEIEMNFTDAADYCKRHNGYLTLLNNQQEELEFSRIVVRNELFHSKCDAGFLGYRMVLEEAVKMNGSKVATFTEPLVRMSKMWLPDDDWSNGDCVVLYHNPDSNAFGLKNIPCESELQCYICETTQRCKKPVCYVWHYHAETINFTTAKTRCAREKSGQLAKIRNNPMLNLVRRAVNASEPKSLFSVYSEEACTDGYFVDKQREHTGRTGFESLEEKPIKYISPAILLTDYTSRDGHCLAVSKSLGYRWIPVPCHQRKCFFCRFERL